MKQIANTHRKRRPSLINRFSFWLSASKRVDGLWIGTLASEPEVVLQRVESALCLIKTYDRLRYDRLIRDLERVWVMALTHPMGSFNQALNACMLDPRFVMAEKSSLEMIASVIVHEATHARLMRCGIGYEEGIRTRVEAVCLRQELAFAKKLPNGEEVHEQAESVLESPALPEYLTDTALAQRHADGATEALRYLAIPAWLAWTLRTPARTVLALRAARGRVSRLLWRPRAPQTGQTAGRTSCRARRRV